VYRPPTFHRATTSAGGIEEGILKVVRVCFLCSYEFSVGYSDRPTQLSMHCYAEKKDYAKAGSTSRHIKGGNCKYCAFGCVLR
jgi:hypothetical protein